LFGAVLEVLEQLTAKVAQRPRRAILGEVPWRHARSARNGARRVAQLDDAELAKPGEDGGRLVFVQARHVEDHLDGAPAVDERHHETRATVEWEHEDVVVGGDEPRNRVEWNGSGDVAARRLELAVGSAHELAQIVGDRDAVAGCSSPLRSVGGDLVASSWSDCCRWATRASCRRTP
jgi:hypothetical protein